MSDRDLPRGSSPGLAATRLPFSRPWATASRTAISIARWEGIPTFVRNFHTPSDSYETCMQTRFAPRQMKWAARLSQSSGINYCRSDWIPGAACEGSVPVTGTSRSPRQTVDKAALLCRSLLRRVCPDGQLRYVTAGIRSAPCMAVWRHRPAAGFQAPRIAVSAPRRRMRWRRC